MKNRFVYNEGYFVIVQFNEVNIIIYPKNILKKVRVVDNNNLYSNYIYEVKILKTHLYFLIIIIFLPDFDNTKSATESYL